MPQAPHSAADAPPDRNGAGAHPVAAGLRLRARTSPAAWYAWGGAALLVLMVWLVIATARRSARIEERGDRLAEVLLREATRLAPIDWSSEGQRRHLFACLVAAASAEDVFVADLVLEPAEAQLFTCRNKHYCIAVRPSPHADADQIGGPGAEPLEAMAWPLNASSPAHAVFFYPEDAEPSFSRNLQAAYAETEPPHRPQPGLAHRRPDTVPRAWEYRGYDDERWLLRDRNHGRP